MSTTLASIIDAIPSGPPRVLFADLGGEPTRHTENQKLLKECELICDLVTKQMSEIVSLLQTDAASPDVLGIADLIAAHSTNPSQHHHHNSSKNTDTPLRSGILIEEISNEEYEASQRSPRALELVLQVLVWGCDPYNDLERPWSTPSTNGTSELIFETLIDRFKIPLDIIIAAVVDKVGPTIVAPAVHAATETTRLDPYTGPDTWDRVLANSQLSLIVRKLKKSSQVERVWESNLKYVLTSSLDDSCPTVKFYALRALEHIFKVSKPQYMSQFSDNLVELMKNAVIGCDEKVWPAAAAATVNLMLNLDQGTPSTSLRYNTNTAKLFESFLEEGERHSHSPRRSHVWLTTIPILIFPRLGTQLVQYFRRLMPLILEWCIMGGSSMHKSVRLHALHALREIVLATKPRVPPHAHLIWSVLETVYIDESTFSASPLQSQILDAIVRVGCDVYSSGGREFQSHVSSLSGSWSGHGQATTVLQSPPPLHMAVVLQMQDNGA